MNVYVEAENVNGEITNISLRQLRNNYICAILDDTVVDLSKLHCYALKLNEEDKKYHLVYDEEHYNNILKEKEKEAAIEEGTKKLEELQFDLTLKQASDKDAYIMRYMYPEYAVGVTYNKGDRFIYQDKFYKVVASDPFTSTEEWKPDVSPSLYVEISDPNVEYPEFKQPINAETAYKKGDKITFKNEKYVSLIDNNAYSPEEYPAGWEKVN